MALTKGTNSYVTVEEADAYFNNRLDAAAWTNATPERKGQALITGTNVLDQQSYIGTALSVDQPLAFPRAGAYFDPKLGMTVTLDSTVPKRVEQACCEEALHLLSNEGLLSSTGTVQDLTVGSISLTMITNPGGVAPAANTLVRPLLSSGAASGYSKPWYRAN